MKRGVTSFALVALMPLLLQAQPRDPSEVKTRYVTATEGQPLLVRNYAMWRSDCSARGEPVVTITTQPQHGTVDVRPGLSTIREYSGNGGNCVGHQVPGMSVWYRPAPGYRGPDQFALTVNTGHVLRDVMMVTVR